jgi:hypothetical protein
MKNCIYCKEHKFSNITSNNIGFQKFNDNTISSIFLNPFDPSLITSSTYNIPERGASDYRVFVRIKFCPMCGRDLRKTLEEDAKNEN